MDTIDIHAKIDRINEAREALHMTHQQLADASGVPIQTVTRILGHKTDNPYYSNIAALELAVGLSYDAQSPKTPEPTGDAHADLIAALRHQLAQQRYDYETRIAAQRREYRMREAEHRRLSRILGCALAVVGVLLVAVLVYDALHGNIGYIRYANPFTSIKEWLF